jgi:hypothetical protein
MKAVMTQTPGKVLCVSKIPFVVETVADLNEDENAKVSEYEDQEIMLRNITIISMAVSSTSATARRYR